MDSHWLRSWRARIRATPSSPINIRRSRVARREASSAPRACAARRSCASAFPLWWSSRCAATSTRALRKLDEGQYDGDHSRCCGSQATRLRRTHRDVARSRGQSAGDRAGCAGDRMPHRIAPTSSARWARSRIGERHWRSTAERAFGMKLAGDCHTPLAAFATTRGDELWLRGLIASRDGTRGPARRACDATSTTIENAVALGEALGAEFLARDAARILASMSITRGAWTVAGILITRPARQAAGFARQVAAIGGTPLIFPAIVILPPDDRTALDRAQRELARYDFAVFVSANAVEYGVGDPRHGPRVLIAFAPGTGHRQRARGASASATCAMPTTTMDSEGLLALPEFAAVAGKRVLIFRGGGGRELLGETLAARGAIVDYGRLLSPLTARGRRGGPRGGAWRGTHRCSDADEQRRHRQPLGAAGSCGRESAWRRRRRSCRIRALPRARASWVSLESPSPHPRMPACSRHC